ncbi:fibronectin type III domain-containing protein [Brevibacillus humidisoli]|uniref:fibronectin type III domain-containing protein n=1 Tax=Brevibacillus humidisoli TaxID=2895522 RepID=UPI001E2F15B1|nr:fibronectin type III domain-containing protein [Brevibacillus humidisoli]UFJ41427.1 fibronectin type III domain-containing protein [Brevibacillus humidisoli]
MQTLADMPDPPEAPLVEVERVTSISAYLTWKPVEGATVYKIRYMGYEQELRRENVKITGLQPDRSYVFTITAANEAGESDPVEVEIETVPFSYEYIYDGSLLKQVMSSYEEIWTYYYDDNGNNTEVIYQSEPDKADQEFDIS